MDVGSAGLVGNSAQPTYMDVGSAGLVGNIAQPTYMDVGSAGLVGNSAQPTYSPRAERSVLTLTRWMFSCDSATLVTITIENPTSAWRKRMPAPASAPLAGRFSMSRILRGVLPVIAALFVAPAMAQPSGGPYGPIPQTYEVPTSGTVYYVAPDGDANAPGTSLSRPTTIESAIARVVTGDAIVLRGGTYRTGSLQLNQGITIQPYRDEKPVLKGTKVATEWQELRDGIWRTKWSTLFPARPLGWWQRWREGMRTPLHRFNNDMVFVDGKLLKSVGWEGELDADSFFIDYDGGYVYIGVDPKDKLVEITAHDI